MQEAWVRSLGWEDPLEKELANHSSILAWEIPWTEEPGGLSILGLQTIRRNLATTTATTVPDITSSSIYTWPWMCPGQASPLSEIQESQSFWLTL